jgi:hypothetical protein
MNEDRMKPRGSLVWPLVLIGIGVLFLLSNLGIVDWEIWPTLLRLWPLLLVAVGLDLLLGRRSGIWAGITIVIVMAMFAGGIWLVQTTTSVWTGELITEEIVQELGEAEYAEVYINMGVGVLEIDSLKSESLLISGTVEIAEDEEIIQEFDINRDTAGYTLSTRGQEYYPSWLINQHWDGDKNWKLSINDAVPVDLKLNCGVGVADVDVSGLILRSLVLDNGVGETDVYLPATGQYTVRIDAGVGQITVHIPAGLAVQMNLDTGLGNTSISGDFIHRNGLYTTEGFEEAENYAEVSIDGGVGEIVIIQDN